MLILFTVQPPYFAGLGGRKILTVKWRGTLYFAVCRFTPFCVISLIIRKYTEFIKLSPDRAQNGKKFTDFEDLKVKLYVLATSKFI